MNLPHDKKLHLVAGFAIAWLSGIACLKLGMPLWIAGALAVLAGALKEARDALGYGDCDLWDFVATMAGVVAALTVLFVVRGAS